MDVEYQRRLLASQFEHLEKRVAEESLNILAERVGDVIFARFYGAGGSAEPYVARITSGLYPIQPWRVGFIDPTLEGNARLTAPDRDSRFWPFSALPGLDGGFHVSFQGPFRVFVCRPFTVEYFYYHPDRRWDPQVFVLARVVIELASEVRKAEHFSKWFRLLRSVAQ